MSEMRPRFAAIALIFIAFVGIGVMSVSAQEGVYSATPGSSIPMASQPTTYNQPTTGQAASGQTTYSDDYRQGMVMGLRMGFTMGTLSCSSQFNESALKEYNSRVEVFNQMIRDVFGTSATQEMFLQPINATSARAAAPASTVNAPNVGEVAPQTYIPGPQAGPQSFTNFTYSQPIHQIDGAQKVQTYFNQNNAGQFQNKPAGISDSFSGKDANSLGTA
jgi:hypothetical protein